MEFLALFFDQGVNKIGAIQFVAKWLILAKATCSFVYLPSLKRDGNEFARQVMFIAVGFSRRIKGHQSRALAKCWELRNPGKQPGR
jgi:hypothetical protein